MPGAGCKPAEEMGIAAKTVPALLAVAALVAAGCDTGSATADAGHTPTGSPGEAAPTETTEPSSPASRLLDKTFDDIKFDIEPDAPFSRDMLTPTIEALDGKQIRIRGYILPTAQKRGLKEFVLVRDNLECCFGPGAALYDCILIEMESGKTTEFSVRPVAVTGRFAIRELKLPDGTHLAIYRMLAEGVE